MKENYFNMEAACGFLINLLSITKEGVFNLGDIDSSTLANIIIDIFQLIRNNFAKGLLKIEGKKLFLIWQYLPERNYHLKELACSLLFPLLKDLDCLIDHFGHVQTALIFNGNKQILELILDIFLT